LTKSNLFIREKYALIDRKAEECQHVSYFSFSPRYSQMSRGQLKWYLWWRENIRNGVYLKTDESYITLYTYELAAADTADEAQKSVAILCSLLNNYSVKDITIVGRMMIRDIICDLCIIYALDSPLSIINESDSTLFFNTFLPEFFIDLYGKTDFNSTKLYITSISMYDYRKSKYYNEETETVFNDSISGVLNEIFKNDRSFNEIMAFASGKYGCITAERRPFTRMVNIVNRDVKYEIKYYQISGIQSVITDAIRYSENRIREHLGIKNKLHILAVNPILKQVIDTFYDTFYPAKPTIDRRKTAKTTNETEVHEYDRFYDVPKVEISAEHAIEIEQLSWNTTKILTEAFSTDDNQKIKDNTIASLKEDDCISTNNDSAPIITDHHVNESSINSDSLSNTGDGNDTCLFIEIKNKLGKIADFLLLCKNGTALDQRRFSSDNSLSVDEIADEINEVSVDIFGDIILESTDEGYRILDDYKDQVF